MGQQAKVIVGLGNPGVQFRSSRHNLGFMVVEQLAKKQRINLQKFIFDCLVGEKTLDNRKIVLVKPLTFVNLSGQAVAQIIKSKKIRLEDLLVVCDDVNLTLGRIRLRSSGSDGGHKGLRSIIQILRTKDFARLRIGVGRRAEKGPLSEYVLGRFRKNELKTIKQAIEQAACACGAWMKNGIQEAMNEWNRKGE